MWSNAKKIREYELMLEADRGHLADDVAAGNSANAQRRAASIAETQKELNKLRTKES